MRIESIQNQSFKGQLYPPKPSRTWIDDYESIRITRDLNEFWEKRAWGGVDLEDLYKTIWDIKAGNDKTLIETIKDWLKTLKNKKKKLKINIPSVSTKR